MPPAYAPALLARVRAEYVLPRQAYGRALVAENRFGLVEGPIPDDVDFVDNGRVVPPRPQPELPRCSSGPDIRNKCR
ncbi:hypothetical protein [Micromonospora olivasterospora]